jgi:sigma-B regulation protein RsbU (phosphoserine phosphatase)
MTKDLLAVDVTYDWTLACDVEARFMQFSSSQIRTLTYSARCRQMRAIGGDCFDFVPLPGRRIALTVADASGKGLPAALIIANVQSSLRTAALFAPDDPAAAVTAVNRQLHASSPVERYASLFYGVFDEDTRTLHYVNAGHNPPMLIRRSGHATWLEADAPPVGFFADTVYRMRTVQLHPGDLIVAWTDGVVEATNRDEEEWGVDGLLATVAACPTRQPDSIVASVFTALDEFSGDTQTDDATILAALVS